MAFLKYFFVVFILFSASLRAYATADGPDYFKVSDKQNILLYQDADMTSPILTTIPAGTDYLKNMGCQGAPSLSEWEQMTTEEQTRSREKIWCKITYKDNIGWVKNTDIREGSSPSGLPHNPNDSTLSVPLIPEKITATYICNNNPNEKLIAHFYNYPAQSFLTLEYKGETELLFQTISASGARYKGIGDSIFWSKGNEAQFQWRGNDTEQHCETDD